MHATYIPFQLPSVGHSVFFWEFSCTRRTYHFNYQVWGFLFFFWEFLCTRRTYHFNYQVWGFPVSFGNFRARDVRTISTTKCGVFCFLLGIFVHATYIPFQLPGVGFSGFFWEFSCTRCTYHINYQVWGFLFSFGNFCARDVHTISTTRCGVFRFLLGIFVHATYVPWPLDNTGARSGSPQ